MRILLHLTRDDIQQKIPYPVVCEARYGARWNTGTVRRRWTSEFTQLERSQAYRLFAQARLWHLIRGVPNEIKMTSDTYSLWQKLGNFCATI